MAGDVHAYGEPSEQTGTEDRVGVEMVVEVVKAHRMGLMKKRKQAALAREVKSRVGESHQATSSIDPVMEITKSMLIHGATSL